MATKKSSGSKTVSKTKGGRAPESGTPPSKRWSSKVQTDSTKPGPGLFTKSAKAIADGLASKKVSPEGPGQAVRMLNFYENRGGKNLSGERHRVLEHAKSLLHEKVVRAAAGKSTSKKSSGTNKSTAKKAPAKKPSARNSAGSKSPAKTVSSRKAS